jgi:hypothetical protein
MLLKIVFMTTILPFSWGFCLAHVDVSRFRHQGQAVVLQATVSTFENSIEPTVHVIKSINFLEERRPLKTALLALSARTNRGEIASNSEKSYAMELVNKLESFNPTPNPAASDLFLGTWELVYSSTHLFRSSPFFMAARAICKEGYEADQFNLFCDLHRQALAFTSIGKVRQIITDTTLISEFETVGAMLPGLPLTIKGTIESSADIEERSGSEITLYMDKVRIKEGTSNIPIFRTVLDQFTGLPIRTLASILERQLENYSNPRPVVRTKYIDTHMRISRDQEDNIFVFNRVT